MLPLRDFLIVCGQCQTAMTNTRNTVPQLTVHMNKMKILLGDIFAGRWTPNIAPKDLKISLDR